MMRVILAFLVFGLLTGCASDTLTSPTVELFRLRNGDVERLSGCSEAAPCELQGGQDALIVRATYAGVNIEHSTEVTPPTLTVLENGQVVDGPRMVGVQVDPRAFESEPYLAPSRDVARMGIHLVAEQGYEATLYDLKVKAPELVLDGGCGDEGCVRGTGKGAFTFRTWIPLDTPVKVKAWIDDTPLGIVSEPAFDTSVAGEAEGNFSLTAPDGDKWVLQAFAGDLASNKHTLNLVAAPEEAAAEIE